MRKKLPIILLIALLSMTLIMAVQDRKVRIPSSPNSWDIIDLSGQKWKAVQVCAASGKLPTEYCYHTETRYFKAEETPTEFCEVHTPQLTYPVKKLMAEFKRPVYLTSWLFPTLLIYKKTTFEEYREFIDTLVTHDYGNAVRVFSAGVWEKPTVRVMRHPFVKTNGKYDLDQINQEWLSESLRRIRYFVRCGGTIVYTLIDGCSLYPNRDGWWKYHWWNGRNNINGTCADMKSVRHMYAWADMGLPGAAETKHYVLKFMRDMVRILEEEFPGSIVYDFNEFRASPEWYLNVDRDVFQEFRIPKLRKMFSIAHPDFGDVALIMQKYIWQSHGVCGLVAYSSVRIPGPGFIQPSADGCVPPAGREQAKWIVYSSLMDGRIGFENNRRWNPEIWDSIEAYWSQADWNIAKGMKEGFLRWYGAYK